jgi:hypothetical protein
VKPGGEQEKFVVPKGKPGSSLRDPSLANYHALQSGAQRLTNNGPFFESSAHTGIVHAFDSVFVKTK